MDTTNARITLAHTFDSAWTKLTDRQRQAMAIDLGEMANDEEFEGCDLYEVAHELFQRIGGNRNLESYAKCVEITYAARLSS